MRRVDLTSVRAAIIIVTASFALAACDGKHPSSLVGTWKSGEQGFFSTQVVLTLNGDGTGVLHASVGIFGGDGGSCKWEYVNDQLILREPDGSAVQFKVVSKSNSDLVVQIPENGALMSFKRIND